MSALNDETSMRMSATINVLSRILHAHNLMPTDLNQQIDAEAEIVEVAWHQADDDYENDRDDEPMCDAFDRVYGPD